jgi:hypothetical protein
MENEIALELANRKAEEKIQLLQTKLVASSDRLDTCTQNVNYYIEKMSDLSKQINNTEPKNTELKTNYNLYKEMYEEAVKKQEAAIKEIQALSNTNDPDIVKSDLSELFNNFIDNYRDFLSTLSSEQMVIVFNIIGYCMLLMIFTSITTLLIGDQLINFFKLETKYPKIAKYIKFKQTLNKYYLRFYIVLLYTLLLILIFVNIFFFLMIIFYKYKFFLLYRNKVSK